MLTLVQQSNDIKAEFFVRLLDHGAKTDVQLKRPGSRKKGCQVQKDGRVWCQMSIILAMREVEVGRSQAIPGKSMGPYLKN